jgi:hypothetical protein
MHAKKLRHFVQLTAMSSVIKLAGVGALKVPPLCLGASGLGNMGGAISDGTALDTVHAMIDDALSVSPSIPAYACMIQTQFAIRTAWKCSAWCMALHWCGGISHGGLRPMTQATPHCRAICPLHHNIRAMSVTFTTRPTILHQQHHMALPPSPRACMACCASRHCSTRSCAQEALHGRMY